MIRPSPRKLAPLLAGLTAGAVLAGVLVALAEPSRPPPSELNDAAELATAPTRDIPIPSLSLAEQQTSTPTPAAAPTRRPTPTPAAAAGPAAAVLASTNSERAAAGCAPLRADAQLTKAAQGHASDMASRGYFSHTGRDGRSFSQRVLAAGYPRPGGENIAQGQTSAAAVMRAWMDSAGHRANIVNCEFSALGVGFDPNGNYWVQNFGF